MPSFFVKEMRETEDKNTMRCPSCKQGMLGLFREGKTKTEKPYRIYNCSNSIGGCRYQWSVYNNNEAEILSEYHRQMDRFFTPQTQTNQSGQNVPNIHHLGMSRNPHVQSPMALPPTIVPPSPQDINDVADELPF